MKGGLGTRRNPMIASVQPSISVQSWKAGNGPGDKEASICIMLK